VAIRQALVNLVDRLPEDDPGLEVGLRLVGGRFNPTYPAACDPVPAAVPAGVVNRQVLRTALAGIRARGEAPLAAAIEAAAADAASTGERGVVVVITDGWDSCGGDLEGVLEHLAADDQVELRVVGIGLNERLQSRYLTHVEVANCRDYGGLVEALACVLDGVVSLAEPAQLEVTVEVRRLGIPVDDALVELVDPMSSAAQPLVLVDDAYHAQVTAGAWALQVDDAAEGVQTWVDLHVMAGEENRFTVELVAPGEAGLEVVPVPARAGSEVSVLYADAPPGDGFVSALSSDFGERVYGAAEPVVGGWGQLNLGMPDGSLECEARYYLREPSGLARVVGRAGFLIQRIMASLEVPDVVYTERPFEVSWQGPDNACDHLALILKGASDDERVTWVRVADGSPLEMIAPLEEGDYELRYLSGVSGRTVARVPLPIKEPEATLEGPAEVVAGSRFEVAWTGPDAAGDHVLVTTVEAPVGSYLSFIYTTAGNPLTLAAPTEAGDYEVRYASGERDRVLWTIPLKVTAIPISVQTPAVVTVGTRFEVRWTGPDRPGDFLTVVPHRAPPKAFLSWAYTSEGNPVSLPAPDDPGEYEVRYVSGTDQSILATAPVVVK
jgi:Ca-activated chloride channel family protein